MRCQNSAQAMRNMYLKNVHFKVRIRMRHSYGRLRMRMAVIFSSCAQVAMMHTMNGSWAYP